MTGHVQVFNLWVTHAEGSRAVGLPVSQSDTFTLGHLVEFLVAHVHTVNLQAVAVLPGVAHLQITEPCLSVKGTLLFVGV